MIGPAHLLGVDLQVTWMLHSDKSIELTAEVIGDPSPLRHLAGTEQTLFTQQGLVKVLVRSVSVDTDLIEVTLGPEAAKLGLEPDQYRKFAPGTRSARMTMVVMEER